MTQERAAVEAAGTVFIGDVAFERGHARIHAEKTFLRQSGLALRRVHLAVT